MRVTVIGRGISLYKSLSYIQRAGHSIGGVLTARESPESNIMTEDFEEYCRLHDISHTHGGRIVDAEEFLVSTNSDIAISANYPTIIPQSVIDLFPLGILNSHGGDLPRYRGNACQAWAIINGEDRIGLCIHKMVGGEVDSGDIVTRDYLSIDEGTKITAVLDWIQTTTPSLFGRALERLQEDPQFVLEKQSKNPADSLRCYPRSPDDGRINWRLPSIEVLRLINASNKPYAGAFAYLNDKKITIWDAELVQDQEKLCAIPGQLLRVEKDFADVACGSGKLRIRLIEYQGQLEPPMFVVSSIRDRFT